ncbi:fibronectin type III domain-containing protein [Candidatus Uhrbacteria bacterium]|nr:fibronectin type III domain-containing protein [Candidatus Uhrbacteria bacterium]
MSPPTPNPQPLTPVSNEPEIIVIPEKFYGMALKLNAPPQVQKETPPPPPPPPPKPLPPSLPASAILTAPRHPIWPVILFVIGLIVLVGGLFTYFNRGLLFGQKPVSPPVVTAPIVVSPSAATNLSATTSGGTVTLNWVDTATTETGYRIERGETQGIFTPLTSLPQNSSAFLDVSVSGGKNYQYRVIAVNDGGESAPSNEADVQTPLAAPTAPALLTLPPSALDSDSDGLTDIEEPLYGTDIHNPDADKDGFLDGNEVFNLYNPAAQAPVRLLDSGIVKNLSASAGWSLYIPAKLNGILDVPDGTRATIATGHGETFVITLEDNVNHLPLLDWYLGKNPGIVSSAVRSFTTKGGLEGVFSVDRLDAYFAWGGKIFSLRYLLNDQPFINFRTTFEMMLNSLRLPGAPVISCAQIGGPGSLTGINASSTSPEVATSSRP